MSFSVFYAVRFSPAPELGEWLNVAVVGEGINERKAGVIVTESIQRIEAAFGSDAVERVTAICNDLTNLVALMASAHDRGEETQPIPTAMRDQALSLSFSEQIVVFEGSFEDALTSIAKKYLDSGTDESTDAEKLSSAQNAAAGQSGELKTAAKTNRSKFAQFCSEIFPASISKSLEQGQKVIETLVHGTENATVLVIGGGGHLGAALLPKLLEGGKKVRLLDPSVSGMAVVEITNPHASAAKSIAEIAKRAGVSAESVARVLYGATERIRISQKTVDKIREIAGSLGQQLDDPAYIKLHPHDIEVSMAGVDAVIYIPESTTGSSPTAGLEACEIYAEKAKAAGVKRFIFAGSSRTSDPGRAKLEIELHNLGDDHFTVTLLRLGELYGHASGTQWYGDLHNEAGELHDHQTVNVLTAQAIINGRVSVTETEPRPYLHVEDAVDSVIGVLNAPAHVVNRQIYGVSSEDQIRTVGEIAEIIKQHAPTAEVVVKKAGEAELSSAGLSKIPDELGISPSRSLQAGISQLVRALQDGSVSAYMSVRAPDPEVQTVEQEPKPASEIQWQNLARTPVEVESEKSATDQSLRQH